MGLWDLSEFYNCINFFAILWHVYGGVAKAFYRKDKSLQLPINFLDEKSDLVNYSVLVP